MFIPTPNLYSIVYHNFDPTNKKVQGCNKHLFAKREIAALEYLHMISTCNGSFILHLKNIINVNLKTPSHTYASDKP